MAQRDNTGAACPGFRFAQSGLGTMHGLIIRLAKSSYGRTHVSSPVPRQQSCPHIAMKRRIRPVSYARYELVLDRVEMDVVDVPFEISIVTNGVLPEPPLPECSLPISMGNARP